MKIDTFINHGTMIEITGNQAVTLYVDKGEVRLGDLPAASAGTDPATTAGPAPAEPASHFTPEQAEASGIRCQPLVALNLMHSMLPRCTQKVDWLSFYVVLLRRRWVDGNLRAWCRLVEQLFGCPLDARTLATDLSRLGGADYTCWTDSDKRIVRRKQLAADFDRLLIEYFEQKRAGVLSELMGEGTERNEAK